jgi:hypothetical protein
MFCDIDGKLSVSAFAVERAEIDMSVPPLLFPKICNYQICSRFFIGFTVDQDVDVSATSGSDCKTVYVFQDPSLFFIFFPDLSHQFTGMVLHFFPCRFTTFEISESDPVIPFAEVPLDQSSNIAFALPLVMLRNLFWSGFPSFLSDLTCCSILSGMLFFDLYCVPTVPSLSDISA